MITFINRQAIHIIVAEACREEQVIKKKNPKQQQ